MSTDRSSTTVVVVPDENAGTFIKRNHELQGLLNDLNSASPEALRVIKEIMNNKKSDDKLRLACADKILNFQVSVAGQINSETVQRQVAEIKFNRGPMPLGGEARDVDNTPVIDFNTIRTIE